MRGSGFSSGSSAARRKSRLTAETQRRRDQLFRAKLEGGQRMFGFDYRHARGGRGDAEFVFGVGLA
jgi:hypothetical protein